MAKGDSVVMREGDTEHRYKQERYNRTEVDLNLHSSVLSQDAFSMSLGAVVAVGREVLISEPPY